jgi:hypothetical protein
VWTCSTTKRVALVTLRAHTHKTGKHTHAGFQVTGGNTHISTRRFWKLLHCFICSTDGDRLGLNLRQPSVQSKNKRKNPRVATMLTLTRTRMSNSCTHDEALMMTPHNQTWVSVRPRHQPTGRPEITYTYITGCVSNRSRHNLKPHP